MQRGSGKIAHFFRLNRKLLLTNFGTLLVFELLYKISLVLIFRPLLQGLFRLTLRLRGLSYLSDETIGTYLRGPAVWIIFFLLCLGMAYLTLLDLCFIIQCFHASFHGQKTPLPALVRDSAVSAAQIFRVKNWLMILYLLILIPMTQAAVMRGYMAEFSIPEFIGDYITEHTLLMAACIAAWIYLAYICCCWLYSLHGFCLEGRDFREARAESEKLLAGNFWKDLILTALWSAALTAVYYALIMGGSWLVAAANRTFARSDLISSLTLSGISLLMGIVGLLYYCFSLPAVYLFISFLFYMRKEKKGEEIPGPRPVPENALRLTGTGWAKKLYRYRKRIIAVSLAAVLLVGFAASMAEKKGLLDGGSSGDVMVTAHRGYSKQYPENTIPAFKGAVEIGADCIELDVRQTKDEVLVVIHDDNTKRTCGVDLNIWETDYENLKNLDAGSWFDEAYYGTEIPTLEEVVKYAKGKICLNIELKPTGYETENYEADVVEIIEKYHAERWCTVASKDYECLENVKALNEDIETLYITSVSYGDFTSLEAADGFSVEATMLTKQFVESAHEAGKEVQVWTVNTEDSMEQVLELGVDGIITDEPAAAQELIYEQSHTSLWDDYVDRLLELGE